jgi:membrane-associated phospholipid phosphatase
MIYLVSAHRAFFLAFGALWLGGLALAFRLSDGEEVLFFGAYRGALPDTFFRIATLLGEGYPFLIAGIVLWWFRRKFPLDISLLGICTGVVSFLAKAWFSQDRPYAFFQKAGKLDLLVPVEGVVMHTGATSFPSGHTMAAFALFTFLALLKPGKSRLSLLFLFLAVLVGISRIYLGQHFLQDVLAGALSGTLIAVFLHLMLKKEVSFS